MKAWLWSLKCSLVYRGRSGWGAEECQWGFVYHKWVIAMKQLGPAGWSSLLCYGQQKTWQLDRAGGLNAFLTAISWVFCGQAGTDGGHGRRGTSSSRFYKGLLTIGFTTGLNDIRGAGLVQTGGCESGPLLLSKMPAGHTATVALNGVSGVPAPCSCAIVMPQIKSVYRGNLNMGSLRALHPLRETQMHSAGSFSAVAHSCHTRAELQSWENCKSSKNMFDGHL